MKQILLVIILFSILTTSCSFHDESKKQTVSTINVAEVAKDIKLPRNLFKEFERELAEEFKTIGPVFVYVPLDVQFNQKVGQKILRDSPLLFRFEKGGGQIDLKEVVDGVGSFYMSFPSKQFSSTAELVHLFYISQSPVKVIGEENFGLGCGKWIDIKSSFTKLQNSEFLKLNTTGQRYLHVLAGHYVFVFKQTNQISLTQLTVTDSRYPNELCTSLAQIAGENQ